VKAKNIAVLAVTNYDVTVIPDTTTVQLTVRCTFGGPARLRNLIHQAIPSSQPSQLAFLYQQGGSLWKPRRDIALEGDRTSAETQPASNPFELSVYDEICSHNESTVLKPVHVQRKQLAQRVLLTLNLGCPQKDCYIDEKRVVGDMSTDAQPAAKTI
jgi:hypothetical protein